MTPKILERTIVEKFRKENLLLTTVYRKQAGDPSYVNTGMDLRCANAQRTVCKPNCVIARVDQDI